MSSQPKRPMSEDRRQRMAERWTPEMRAEQSQKAKARYEAWAAEHPDRAALVAATWKEIEDGQLERPTCSLHDRPAHPSYDWTAMQRGPWRCRAGHWL